MHKETLKELGKKLAEKITKEINDDKCETFSETSSKSGYCTEITASMQEYNLLYNHDNGDIVSIAFEQSVENENWAKDLKRIGIFLINNQSVQVRAYTA